LLIRESKTQTREQLQRWDDEWSTTFPVSNLTPGRYRIKASIEDTTAIRTVRIGASGTHTQTSAQLMNTVKPTEKNGVSLNKNTAVSDQTPTQVPPSPTEKPVETTVSSPQEPVESQVTSSTGQSKPSENSNNNMSGLMLLGSLTIFLIVTFVFLSTRQS
jgi:hypothetical protein